MRLRKQLPSVLDSMLQYCQAVPRGRLFRSAPETLEAQAAEVPVKQPRAPRTPRAAGTATNNKQPRAASGPLVGGRYRSGSAMAMLYERLCDEQPKRLADVLAGVPVSNPMDRLKWLVTHGKETGKWTVIVDKATATMQLHQ